MYRLTPLCKWAATNSFAGFVVNPSQAPRFWKALPMDSPLYYFVLFSNTIQLFTKKKRVAANVGMSLKPQIQVH